MPENSYNAHKITEKFIKMYKVESQLTIWLK